MTENFMLSAYHSELWDHTLELDILACPVAIVSKVVVKVFQLPLVQSADPESGAYIWWWWAFCVEFGQYHYKCDVFVWNQKHTTPSSLSHHFFKRTIYIRSSCILQLCETVMTISLVWLPCYRANGGEKNESWMLVKPSVYWLFKTLKYLPQNFR